MSWTTGLLLVGGLYLLAGRSRAQQAVDALRDRPQDDPGAKNPGPSRPLDKEPSPVYTTSGDYPPKPGSYAPAPRAPQWVSGQTYGPGAEVTFQGKVYRWTAQHNTTFPPEHGGVPFASWEWIEERSRPNPPRPQVKTQPQGTKTQPAGKNTSTKGGKDTSKGTKDTTPVFEWMPQGIYLPGARARYQGRVYRWTKDSSSPQGHLPSQTAGWQPEGL